MKILENAEDWKQQDELLKVWQHHGVEEQMNDGTTKRVRIVIQQIPGNRYDEVIQHMLKFFLAEADICVSWKLKECKDAIEDYRILWKYCLNANMSVGAFKLGSDDSLLELIAVNILYVSTHEVNKDLENIVSNFKCLTMKKIYKLKHDIWKIVDINKIYGIDRYISSSGLSVSPPFRGQKLGFRLIEARNNIGRKYGIKFTSSMFSGLQSQIQAQRAGFETIYMLNVEEKLENDSKAQFQEKKDTTTKIMIKQLF